MHSSHKWKEKCWEKFPDGEAGLLKRFSSHKLEVFRAVLNKAMGNSFSHWNQWAKFTTRTGSWPVFLHVYLLQATSWTVLSTWDSPLTSLQYCRFSVPTRIWSAMTEPVDFFFLLAPANDENWLKCWNSRSFQFTSYQKQKQTKGTELYPVRACTSGARVNTAG